VAADSATPESVPEPPPAESVLAESAAADPVEPAAATEPADASAPESAATQRVPVSEPVTEPLRLPSGIMFGPPGPGTPAGVALRPASVHQQSFWFGLMVAVAVTLVGASFLVGAYLTDAQPETVVRSYFAALSSGDAAGALGYGSVPDGSHELLTDQVLAAQNRVATITGFTVGAVRQHGDAADVDVRYTLALPTGRTLVTDTVPVVRAGTGWRLAHSAVTKAFDKTTGSELATFAGSGVPTGDEPMFPGAAPVEISTPNLALSSPARVIRFADDPIYLFNVDVSPGGRKLIGSALDTAFDRCLTGKASSQVLCPLPDPALAVPGTLLGKSTSSPENSVTFTVSSRNGRIDITGSVPVAAHYDKLDTNNLAVRTDVTSVDVRAHTFATQPTVIVWDLA
jgi:hypothetical protein